MRVPTPRMPIATPSNAVITLSRVGTGFDVDPVTGNEIPQSTSVNLSAFLTTTDDRPKIDSEPGINETDLYLEGFITSIVPSGYELTGTVAMRLTNLATGQVQSGRFTFLPRVTPFTAAVAKVAGMPIAGTFRAIGG